LGEGIVGFMGENLGEAKGFNLFIFSFLIGLFIIMGFQ
jgi:hypothetical protein